jgi:hypothetical protein
MRMDKTKTDEIEEIARNIMDDGQLGEFFRGEMGAPGCDDDSEWLQIAQSLKSWLDDGIERVRDKTRKYYVARPVRGVTVNGKEYATDEWGNKLLKTQDEWLEELCLGIDEFNERLYEFIPEDNPAVLLTKVYDAMNIKGPKYGDGFFGPKWDKDSLGKTIAEGNIVASAFSKHINDCVRGKSPVHDAISKLDKALDAANEAKLSLYEE